jgi:hypothetical protein
MVVVGETQEAFSSEERRLAGMMISRRPWRRASSEYAPGPRHKSAIAMTAVNTAEGCADETLNMGTGIRVRAAPKLIRALRVQATQFHSPNRSKSPHPTESAARSKINTRVPCQATKSVMPEETSATPTLARSNSSPKPGTPSGKIGKVDRSEKLVNANTLQRLPTERIPRPRDHSVPLWWYLRTVSRGE